MNLFELGSIHGTQYVKKKKNLFFLDITDTSLFELCSFVSNSDLVEMENCNGVVVVLTIFNDHNKRGYFLKKVESANCFCFNLLVLYMAEKIRFCFN